MFDLDLDDLARFSSLSREIDPEATLAYLNSMVAMGCNGSECLTSLYLLVSEGWTLTPPSPSGACGACGKPGCTTADHIDRRADETAVGG